jgi:hypothetical protein
MEKDSIKLEINLTPEDLYTFQKSIITRALTPSSKAILIIAMIIFSLGILLSEAYLATKLIRLALLFTIPALLAFLILGAVKRSSVNAFKENKLVLQTQRVTLTQEGIEVQSDSGYSNLQWEQLYRVTEIKESFLFFISKQQAFVIPKRYIVPYVEQYDLIRSFMMQAPTPKGDKTREKFYKYLLIGLIAFLAILGIIMIAILFLL